MTEETQGENSEEVPLLAAPRHPLPEVITTADELARAVSELASGSGDIALDAERASGFKYSQRAYLLQIFRRGGGLHLIDPIAFGSDPEIFAPLNSVIQSAQVVLHASSQDLPCLREIGISPTDLFDTELAGRIAGFPRVGLGALTESLLNIRLAKEHSAVDWSQRPLHHDWLLYAALDVDVLLDLKDEIVRELIAREKLEWAIEESAAALAAPPPSPRKDPWRRTSGIHQVKRPDQLAIVRELWRARDELARERDIAAGRILNDRALMSVAVKPPTTLLHAQSIPALKKDAHHWWRALEVARANPTLPKAPPSEGPPTQIRVWKERAPLAYARLTHARSAIAARAGELVLPAENLLSPDLIRRFCWQDPPAGGRSEGEVAEFLRALGARPWQVAFTAPLLLAIEGATEPLVVEAPPDERGEGVSELS
jgi:ribonuclease D